jgi:hypothetical protein
MKFVASLLCLGLVSSSHLRVPAASACECIPCGSSTPWAVLPSGSCGPAVATCGSSTAAGQGCYTDCAGTCDCHSRTCQASPAPTTTMAPATTTLAPPTTAAPTTTVAPPPTPPTPAVPTPAPAPPTPAPAPTGKNYYCNWQDPAGPKCVDDISKPEQTLEDCSLKCAPAVYARCNAESSKCEECTFDPFTCPTTEAVCTAKCGAAPTPTPSGDHFYCDWNTMQCKEDPKVPVQSKDSCAKKCVAAEYASCNTATGQCTECKWDPATCTTEKDVCKAKCKPVEQTWFGTTAWYGMAIW